MLWYNNLQIRKYDDDEWNAIEIIQYMIENEDLTHLECVLMDIVNNHNDNDCDVVGLINDYEYVKC